MSKTIVIDAAAPLRVLQLTDLHIGARNGAEQQRLTMKLVDDAIEATHPDFIALTGDLSIAPDAEASYQWFCDHMAAHAVPWGFCFGNHDRDYVRDPRCLEKILEADPYCVYGNDDLGVFGYGNYNVVFTDETGKILHVFYFFDNARVHHWDGLSGLTCGSLSQNRWFRKEQERLKETGSRFHTWAFMHMPLHEYTDMWKQGNTHGVRHGDDACCPVNTGMFCTFAEDEFFRGVFCGHDHGTFYGGDYMGIKLLFGRTTGFHQSKLGETVYPCGARVCDLLPDGTIKTFFFMDDGSFRDEDDLPFVPEL